MRTVKDVLALLGLLLVVWVVWALIEALPHAIHLVGK
jgi:hypothetical protein